MRIKNMAWLLCLLTYGCSTRPTFVDVCTFYGGNLRAESGISENASEHMAAFGLQIGQVFTVSECPKEIFVRKIRYAYSTELCFQRSGDVAECGAVVTDNVTVKFPIGDILFLVPSSKIWAQVIDGQLEGVSFSTGGIGTAESTLEKLVKKYGTAAMIQERTVQNRLGAQFQAFIAIWTLDGLTVVFNSVSSSLDSGRVSIRTPKGKQAYSDNLDRVLEDKRSL